MLMMPDAPAACSASPLIAWIEEGMSRTRCALSLLAVTTISCSPPELSTGVVVCADAATARPAATAAPVLHDNSWLVVLWRIPRSLILCWSHDSMSYHMKYQLNHRSASLLWRARDATSSLHVAAQPPD